MTTINLVADDLAFTAKVYQDCVCYTLFIMKRVHAAFLVLFLSLVVLTAVPCKSFADNGLDTSPAPIVDSDGVSVTGRVTDAEGTPIAGANVYALCSFTGPLRGYQQVLMGSSDANGRYAFDLSTGRVRTESISVSLIASKPGLAPAVASAASMPDKAAGAKNPHGDLKIDLVLPHQKAVIIVRVVQDGKPVTNATVGLAPHFGTPLFEAGYMGSICGEARDAVQKLILPITTTGIDGTVMFNDLTPGLWDITAARGSHFEEIEYEPHHHFAFGRTPTAANFSEGVAVQANQISRYTLNLSNWTKQVPVHLVTTNPTPGNAEIDAVSPVEGPHQDHPGNTQLSGTLDGFLSILEPGLWRITARLNQPPIVYPEIAPYDQGDTVIAYAPEALEPTPVVLRTMRVELGWIHVKLRDKQGRPVAGIVTLDASLGSPGTAETTDEHGEVLFQNLSSGDHWLTAVARNVSPLPRLDSDPKSLPDDSVFLGHAVFVTQTVAVHPDQATDAILQLQPVGYVKGRIRSSPGDVLSRCQIAGPSLWDPGAIPRTYRIKTGEFVSGPYLEGKADVCVRRSIDEQSGASIDGTPVSALVSANHVAHVTLTTRIPSLSQVKTAIDDWKVKPLAGVIFLPDGKTPAWAARAVGFMPNQWTQTQLATADALGQFNDDGWETDYDVADPPPSGSPTVPVVVAYLPGSNGAAIAPYIPGRPVRLTLPAPVSLRGRVTVDGKSVAALNSTFRIRAAYQGRGKLNDVLSVETTAQADGSFALNGLTPGVYQIQAARDGIWLSDTQTITAGDQDLPDRTFDIGLPGAAIVFHVRDAAGKPLVKQTVTLMRPPGPLTELLWPKTLTTDGAGDVRIEGLEAGPQSISIGAKDSSRNSGHPSNNLVRTIAFNLPVYQPSAEPIEKTVVLDAKADP